MDDLTLERLAIDGSRVFFAIHTPSLAAWPSALDLPSRYFACLVIADGTSETTEELSGWAHVALEQGMVFCSAFGPGSNVVEDVVDWSALERSDYRADQPVIITTSHLDSSLVETIEFFIREARPHEAYRSACHSWLLVDVGDFGSALDSRRLLMDQLRR